jgi:hypothetical protein
MLDIVLALDGVADILKPLEIDQPSQSVLFREAFNDAGSMLVDPTDEVIRDSNIKNPVRTICQDINELTGHPATLQDVDGRDKPGHDGRMWHWMLT